MALAAARSRGAHLDLRRAAVRLRGPDRGVQSSGDPRARGGRRRRRTDRRPRAPSWSRWPRLPVSASSSAPADLASAARAIRSGDAIAAVYIPANFERDLKAERRPQVVAFYNQQFLTAAGIASSGLSDSLAAAASSAAAARGADGVPHRGAGRRDDRAGQSGAELRAVPAARAAADGRPRRDRARRRLCGGLRVPAAQHAHLARLRGRQSDRRARGQARAPVRDLLRHDAVGGADPGGTVRDFVQGRRADDGRRRHRC